MKPPTEVVSGLGVGGHHAVRAWRELGCGHGGPVVVELRKERTKSAVYRLRGAGPRGSTVVAKYCDAETGEVERLIYEEILARLNVSALRCYGSLGRDDGARWLFLEDAGEGRFSLQNPEHRSLAARWLADVHMGAAELHEIQRLPDRGSAYYLAQLSEGWQRIVGGVRNPALMNEQRSFLSELAGLYERLEAGWPTVEAVCSPLPPTLVHRDLLLSNVRLREEPGGTRVLVLDWEMAGRGIPAVDVVKVNLQTYVDEVRTAWVLGQDAAVWVAAIGEILHSLDAIEWISPALLQPWARWRIDSMRLYAEQLAAAMAALGLDEGKR